ncbi:uncharacterized protein PV06_07709 [Exophiala oligosperma]|uniref:Uncharacterized protein n=1 Tax=Exophiala oligosperma TaxID=215243 RepID=A0A0D2DBS7_9EURO|nr:uncharacterized protein PV06_07709 [Exophiala oligosperma]KIW40518.1 hypothetical protein PV06_07709 [Exophiala oligosperma]
MPFFKSSNKSHSSIEDIRTEHPHQHPHHQPHPSASYDFDPNPDRYNQQPQLDDDYQFQHPQSQAQAQPQPHSHLSRSQSVSAGEVYGAQRPSVTLVPPPPQQSGIPEGPPPVPGQTFFGQSKSARIERDEKQKKSKRSFISGLIKDKSKDEDKDRDREKGTAPERKGIGRSSSVHLLRKSQPVDQSTRESYSQQTSPIDQSRHSVYYPHVDTTPGSSSEQPQYIRNFDSPQSHTTHYSIDYEEDAPHFTPDREQQQQYQAYHQSESASNSEQYLPYQSQVQRPRVTNIEADQYRHLRPPSQASLGPPSPTANPPHPQGFQDSRPSTSATSRYSVRLGPQGPQQQQQVMAGGEARNGSLRQQLAQRDARTEDHSQGQYQSSQDPRVRMSQQGSEQGRSTPPPRSREDISQLDYHQLLQRHEELQAKYSKVKRYYFEREAQVTQLQNTVANQRMSMTRTSLDDAQYTARFERLSQAINNLAFNIRKNWRAVPPWLRHVCNQDAHSIGTKEMTAVGRACITRWLYESIFEHTFHPGIDPTLSAHLKSIERALRRSGQGGMLFTDEQRDDLITKLTTWRLTTIEGLQGILASPQSEQYIENLNKRFTHQLTDSLKANLTDPPPVGLSEGVGMIVSQAVGIAANIPLESRDICIEYFMPGTPVNEMYMKVEPQMTPLTNPGQDERILAMQAAQAQQQGLHEGHDGDGMSTASADETSRERDVEAEIREAAGKAASQQSQGRSESIATQGGQTTAKNPDKQSKKSSFLGGIVGKKGPISRADSRATESMSNNGGEDQRGNARDSMAVDPSQLAPIPGANEGRIRFAAFLAVEVRGKGPNSTTSASGGNSGKEPGSAAGGGVRESAVNVLFKAPVYEY